MSEILKVNNIKKIYHDKNKEIMAIDNISFSLNEGDFIAIVGPSGCGKSTLLSIINRQEKTSNGYINYYNKTIGYMLQEDALFDWLTVLDNCLLGLRIKKELNTNSKQYVINLLNKYGLKDFIYSYPNSLSGGMRQRVALIRTLALNPDILLMDEPFSALDYQTRINISNDVYNILKKEKKSLILVTHDITEAISICNRIIVLSKRPTHIKNIYDISLEGKSPLEKRNSIDFDIYYQKIWEDMDYDTRTL